MSPALAQAVEEVLDAFSKAAEENPGAVNDVAAGLGLLAARPILKRALRKRGATELQVYVLTSVLSTLSLISIRLQRLTTLAEKQAAQAPKLASVTNIFDPVDKLR